MKKMLFVALFLITGVGQAEEMCTDLGRFNLCLPITTGVQGAFGYNFKGHEMQGLAETSFGRLSLTETSMLVFKAGGITSENSVGAPFVGLDYQLKGAVNPIGGVLNISPGIYGGYDFDLDEYFYGVKASIPIIQ